MPPTKIASVATSSMALALISISTLLVSSDARAGYAFHSRTESNLSALGFNKSPLGPVNSYHRNPHISSDLFLAQSSNSSQSKPLLILFGGAGDNSISNTVLKLKNRLEGQYREIGNGGKGVDVRYFTWDQENESMNAVKEHLRNYPSSPVVMIGHSYGGDTAFKVADKLGKDVSIKLLVTLDPVGNYYGVNNKQDCRDEYPTGSGRISQQEKQCELQRRQRRKPDNTEKWINVWAKGASTLGDAISSLGDRWDGQANADQDVPTEFPHGEASSMYRKAEATVLAALSQGSRKELPSCQASVNKVLSAMKTIGARRPHIFSISRGSANQGRSGNPTNRSDELWIAITDTSGEDVKAQQILGSNMLQAWANSIAASCTNTAIISFGIADWIEYFFVQADGKTTIGTCLPRSYEGYKIIPWGKIYSNMECWNQ
jgi:pimeloyl-ACP methyl ester carboxylesterase